MDFIKSRLRLVESEFIAALSEGEDAFAAFANRFQALLQDVERFAQTSDLDDECAMLVHTTSMRISILADTSVDLYSACDSAFSLLVDELDTMVSHLTIQESHGDNVPIVELHPSQSTPPCELFSRKRRRDSDHHIASTVSEKRLRRAGRCDFTPSVVASSPRCNAPAFQDRQASASPRPMVCAPPRLSKRKRCLSDAGVEPPSVKRMHRGPRLHAVSDSFTTFRHIERPSKPIASQQDYAHLCRDHTDKASSGVGPTGGVDIQPLIQQTSPYFYPIRAITEGSDIHPEPPAPAVVPELDDFNHLLEDLLASYGSTSLPMPCDSKAIPGNSSVPGEDGIWDWPSPSGETSSYSSSSSPSPLSTPSHPLSPMIFHGIDIEAAWPATIDPLGESTCTRTTSQLQLGDPLCPPSVELEGKTPVDILCSLDSQSVVSGDFLCPISDPLEPTEWLRISPCPHMNPTGLSTPWSIGCAACASRTEWPVLVAGDVANF